MTSFAEVTRTARAILTEDDGKLWGISLADVDWIGFDGDVIHLTSDPGLPGYEPTAPGIWTGPLPDGVPCASSPTTWAGKTWAGLVLPLPDDERGPLREVLHEAWHLRQGSVIKTKAGSDTSCPGSDLLDTAHGRIWLRLEIAALRAALLAAEGDSEWLTAAGDAILFRRRRLVDATAEEAARERELDVLEGVTEYTACRLAGLSPADVAAHPWRLPTGENASWVRIFPYHTGPVYGYLLDRADPGWRSALRENPDLQALLALRVPVPPLDQADIRAQAYDMNAIRQEEEQRETRRQARLDTLRTTFTPTGVLRLRPRLMNVTFDPGGVIPLDETGIVYHTFVWRYADGSSLQAQRVLLTFDWQEMWLPLDQTTMLDPVASQGPVTLTGDGWTLTLAAGWRVRRDGETWLAEPPT